MSEGERRTFEWEEFYTQEIGQKDKTIDDLNVEISCLQGTQRQLQEDMLKLEQDNQLLAEIANES